MMQYGKSLISKMMNELIVYGFTGYTVNGDGNIRGHSYSEMWIDEALNIGTIGQVAEPRLNFITKSMRAHFVTTQDHPYVQNTL